MQIILWVALGIVLTVVLIRGKRSLVSSVLAGLAVAVLGQLTWLYPPAALVLWLAMGVIGGTILARKGYPPLLGVLVGLIGGWIGLIVALVLPRTATGREMQE